MFPPRLSGSFDPSSAPRRLRATTNSNVERMPFTGGKGATFTPKIKTRVQTAGTSVGIASPEFSKLSAVDLAISFLDFPRVPVKVCDLYLQ